MNILFFLSPKQDLMYVYDDFTLRQTLEKWENNRYASIPVLNRQGKYVGTLTEGDILWGLKKFHGLDLEAAEDVPISAFPHKRDYKAVTVTTSMDQLIESFIFQIRIKSPPHHTGSDETLGFLFIGKGDLRKCLYQKHRAARTESRNTGSE